MKNNVSFDEMLSGKPKKDLSVSFDNMLGMDVPEPDTPVTLAEPGYTFTYDTRSEPYRGYIDTAEAKHRLPKNLLPNMILTESEFNPYAESGAGALGIMQIVPEHHPGVDPMNVQQAIDYGAGYVRKMYDRFGTWDKAKAAYNMGPGNLERYGERGLEETRNYVDRINLAKVAPAISSVVEEDGRIEEAIERESSRFPKSFIGHDLKPPGGWDELLRPLDEEGKPYDVYVPKNPMVESTKSILKDIAVKTGLQLVATSELAMSLAGGMLLWFPSKIYGLMALPFGADVAKIAEEEIASVAYYPYTKRGRAAAELVGRGFDLFLAPAHKAGEVTSRVYPRLGYFTEFGYELMEFILTGNVVRGLKSRLKPEQKAKVLEAKKSLDEAELSERSKTAEATPDQMMKEAQREVLDAERTQMELVYQKELEKVDFDADLLEAIVRDEEVIAKRKMRPVGRTKIEKPTKAEVRAITEKLPEDVEADFTFTSKKGNEYVKVGDQWYDKGRVLVTNTFKIKAAERGKVRSIDTSGMSPTEVKALEAIAGVKESTPVEIVPKAAYPPTEPKSTRVESAEKMRAVMRMIKEKREKGELEGAYIPEVDMDITDVDLQTGTAVRHLEPSISDYLINREKASIDREIYKDPYRAKAIRNDVNMETQKLKNDVSLWYYGDDSIDIKAVRNRLSDLSETAEDYLWKRTEDGDSYFINPVDHDSWRTSISDISSWARNLDRLKIEQPEVEAIISREIPVKDMTDPFKGKPLTHLRIKSYPSGYIQLKTHEVGIGRVTGKGEIKDGRIIPEGTPIYEKKTITDVLSPYWIEGKNKSGKWIVISRYDDLKLAEEGLQRFTGRVRLKIEPTEVDPRLLASPVDEGFAEPMRGIVDVIHADPRAKVHTVYQDMNKKQKARLDFINESIDQLGKGYHEAAALAERYGIDNILKEEFPKIDQALKLYKEKWKLIDEVTKVEGPKLYTGIPIDKLFDIVKSARNILKKSKRVSIDVSKLTPEERSVFKAAKEWDDAFEAARDAKRFNLKRFLDRTGLHTGRTIHERRHRLRREIIKKYGADGHRMLQYIDAGDAADGRADRMFYEMRKDAFREVPSKLTVQVDAVDLMRRLKDIYGYKTTKEFKPPKGMGPAQTAAVEHLMNIFKKMTPEERATTEKASKIMSDHVRRWVDELVRVGLKSIEEGKALKSHDYRKIRSLTVENMYDQKYKVRIGDKIVRQSDSGIDPLGQNPISMIETDSRVLYKETADRIFRRVSNQEMKLEWKEFDAEHPENEFVLFKDNDVALGRVVRKVPKDWIKDYWYDNGKQKTMYYHPDIALQLLSSGAHMSFPLTRILTTVLGVNLTRFLTVGSSAMWATTRGITMDLGHTFFSGRSFDPKTGKFKRTYSKFAPKYLGQIGKDMASTFYDVITRGEKTGVYEKNGGSMPFLAMRESHFGSRGTRPPGVYEKFLDGLSFWSQSMERWNRVAVMEGHLKHLATREGITLKEAYKNRDMTMEATNVAVERLPYRQGGWLVKEIDKVFGPFISAGYNAGRTFLRGAKENPVDFWARMANIAVPTVGVTAAMTMFASEAKRDTPEWQHTGGPVITLFPDSLNFIDEEGNKRWINVRIPTDPLIATFYNIFRGLTNKMLYEAGMTDVEPNYEAIVDSIIRSLPADTPLAPIPSAFFTYFKNIDVWKNQKVVEEAFDWPESGEEGQRDPKLGQLPKDIGKLTGVSPKRLKAAARQTGMQNNEWAWAIGKLYDAVNNDLDPRLRRQHWAIVLSQTPGLKNLMSVTVPRAYRTSDRKDMKQQDKFDAMLRREELNAKAEGYYWKGVGKESEIEKFVDSFEEDHIRVGLERRRKFIEDVKRLPHRTSWSSVFHTTPEYKAKDFYEIWRIESSPEERIALAVELDKLMEAGYVGEGSEDRFYETLEELQFGSKLDLD